MDEGADSTILDGLTDSDLLGLRLAAQVLTHKAELEGRANVAAYFGRLEYAVQAELASRTTGIRAIGGSPHVTLSADADDEDGRLVSQYLGLLIANDKLSPQLRTACRRLRTGSVA